MSSTNSIRRHWSNWCAADDFDPTDPRAGLSRYFAQVQERTDKVLDAIGRWTDDDLTWSERRIEAAFTKRGSYLLLEFCFQFAERFPEFGDLSRGESVGTCIYTAERFVREFGRYLDPAPQVLYLIGHRHHCPRRHPNWHGYANPDPDFVHAVIDLGDQILSFSERQLDCDLPAIYFVDKTRYLADWYFATPSERLSYHQQGLPLERRLVGYHPG